MADEPQVIRSINWREAFPFTNIFRAFRIAIHPSKLVLGLMALLTLYVGGRFLDWLWPVSQRALVVDTPACKSEIELQEQVLALPGGDFDDARKKMRQDLERRYAQELRARAITDDGKPLTEDQAREAAKSGKYLGTIKDQIYAERDARAAFLEARYKSMTSDINLAMHDEASAAWNRHGEAIDAQRRAIRDADRRYDAELQNLPAAPTGQDRERIEKEKKDAVDAADAALKAAQTKADEDLAKWKQDNANATDAQKADREKQKNDEVAAAQRRRDADVKAATDRAESRLNPRAGADAARKAAIEAADTARKAASEKLQTDLNAIKDAYKNLSNDERARREDKRSENKQKVSEAYDKDTQATYAAATTTYKQICVIKGQGLFSTLLHYEAARLADIARAAYEWNWTGGLAANDQRAPGIIKSVQRFFTAAPAWAFGQHWFYFTLWFLMFLAVWAVFGGAIARISAVQVARDEKLSVRQALRFSLSKFWSFFSAPLIPLGIVLLVGIICALGGLLTNVPFIGPILVGLMFFLALAAGVVMTLVLLGAGGGLNLMYPTIAVEGSDSFDAISRSFSYLYARPWRMAFYTAVAIAYGALTYLFARLFVYLTLLTTRFFAGWLVFTHADSRQGLWEVLFPAPNFWSLPPDIDFMTLGGGEVLGAFLMSVWIFLMIGLLGAFLISFYFSANTVIYYLMRREVDATEMDDVYLEQPEEESAQPAPAVAGTVAGEVPAAAPSAPAAPTAPAAPAPSPTEGTPAPPTQSSDNPPTSL